MHDLTLMDFSLGGLGWLLESQLMWNNLVPLGGELHQLRGNPHYGTRRTEESTIFPLASRLPRRPPSPLTLTTCQARDLKSKFPICCLIMDSPPSPVTIVVGAASLLTVGTVHLSSPRLTSLLGLPHPAPGEGYTGSLFSEIIQIRSSLAEIVQKKNKNKNNHTRLN